MYIQRFYPELCTISRSILLLFISLFFTADTWALSTDKDQPIEIEADYADLDNEKGVTIYRGNVVLTQGTVRMTGDTMTVYFMDGDLDTLIMEGKPARYRQLPDNSKIYDEAEALRMEYYELKSLVILIDKASFKQEGLSFSGNRIEYDTEHSRVKARGSIKQQSGTGNYPKKKRRNRYDAKDFSTSYRKP
ncbi:MAG: lipopolysaccharide transport periplasmic protein LptA, partial [Proteobacteria bacterium]|nr:lipopolysaccharide transport periplasmic protein LptA [Pseudomonadota bacterium]